MKRGIGFKARKLSFKGIFFIFIFAKKFLMWIYHLMCNIRKEAVLGCGECPKCKGLDLEYGTMQLINSEVYYPMTCNKCGTIGQEWYKLNYIETKIMDVKK